MKRRNMLIVIVLSLCFLSGCLQTPAETVPETTLLETQPLETTQPVATEPEMDALKLQWKINNATKGGYATQYTNALIVDTRIGTSGISMRMGMELEMDVSMSSYPFALFVQTRTDLIMADAELSETTQFYCRNEDSLLTAYLHLDTADIWLKSQSEDSASSVLRAYWLKGYPSGLGSDDLVVEESVLDGREVYTMSCTYSGSDVPWYLYESLEPFVGAISLVGLDLSVVQIPTTYYIDAETFLPVQMEMVFEGMDQLLKQILEMQSSGVQFGEPAEALVEVSEYRKVVRNIRFDPVEVPEVPEEGVQRSTEDGSVLPAGGDAYAL